MAWTDQHPLPVWLEVLSEQRSRNRSSKGKDLCANFVWGGNEGQSHRHWMKCSHQQFLQCGKEEWASLLTTPVPVLCQSQDPPGHIQQHIFTQTLMKHQKVGKTDCWICLRHTRFNPSTPHTCPLPGAAPKPAAHLTWGDVLATHGFLITADHYQLWTYYLRRDQLLFWTLLHCFSHYWHRAVYCIYSDSSCASDTAEI